MTSPVRLVATDLDGTLLDDGQRLSSRTIAAVEAAVAAGIHVVAATGRSQWTAAPLLQEAPGIELLVCSNGASLYDVRARASLASYPISDPVIASVLTRLATDLPGCCYGWETDDALHYDAAFLALRPFLDRAASPALVAGAAGPPIRKLMIAHDHLGHHALLDAILSLLPPGCRGSTSGAAFVEVTGDGVDKAFGVARVCERLGVAAEEVVAFGDDHNDLALLQWAGRGIAMANAHARVLAEVRETTLANDADGVAAVLETLLL